MAIEYKETATCSHYCKQQINESIAIVISCWSRTGQWEVAIERCGSTQGSQKFDDQAAAESMFLAAVEKSTAKAQA